MTPAILALCVFGPIASLAMGIARFGWPMSAKDALVIPLVIGPYVILAMVAWWRRSSLWESILVLATVLLVAAFGIWAFGSSLLRGFGNQREMAMDLTVVAAPVVQWLIALILAAAMGLTSGIKSFVKAH